MPDGIAALAGLGVTIPPEESYPFRGIRFLRSGMTVDASFRLGTASAYVEPGCTAS